MKEKNEFNETDFKENYLSKLKEGSLAYYAVKTLIECRGIKEKTTHINTDYKKTLAAIEILEKNQKIQEQAIFSTRLKISVNDKNFKKLNDLAVDESQKYFAYQKSISASNNYNEETICNYFINIQIPDNLFGFSKEFYLSLIITLVLFYFNSRKSEKDKGEILNAINEKQ